MSELKRTIKLVDIKVEEPVIKEVPAVSTYILKNVDRKSESDLIFDRLELEQINSIKDGPKNSVMITVERTSKKDYYNLYTNKFGEISHNLTHCQVKGIFNAYDNKFLETLYEYRYSVNKVTEDGQKRVIFMKGFGNPDNSHLPFSRFLKNRFLIERQFDPDVEYRGTCDNMICILGFYSDRINLSVSKSENGYRLRIYRADGLHQVDHLECSNNIVNYSGREYAARGCQTEAFFISYSKCREAVMDIIKQEEKCDIYGCMDAPKCYDLFAKFNNNTIVKTNELHVIY